MSGKSIRVSTLFILIMFMAFLTANADSIMVPATSNLWLAGMPNGSMGWPSDYAPGQSPAQVTGLVLSPGSYLTFLATGLTDHCYGAVCGLAGPDGDAFESIASHVPGSENGISDITAPLDSLIGVFSGIKPAGPGPAPAALDFTAASRRFCAVVSAAPTGFLYRQRPPQRGICRHL